jgi:hypothetical protein
MMAMCVVLDYPQFNKDNERIYMNNKKLIICSLATTILLCAPVLAQEQSGETLSSFEVSSLHLTQQDNDSDGLFDALRADITLTAHCTGSYMLDARLESPEGTIISTRPFYEYASPVQDQSLSFTAGAKNQTHTIKVKFSGEEIRRAGINGHYVVKLQNMGKLNCPDGLDSYQAVTITGDEFKARNFGENCGMGEDARPCKDVYK